MDNTETIMDKIVDVILEHHDSIFSYDKMKELVNLQDINIKETMIKKVLDKWLYIGKIVMEENNENYIILG